MVRHQNNLSSYGLIIYSFDEAGEPIFLVYKMRDTFRYCDFLRGKWKTRDDVRDWLHLMTPEERARLAHYEFNELWDDLWVDHSCKIYSESVVPRTRFESIKGYLRTIIPSIKSTCHLDYGFPKGKKMSYQESELVCAVREFYEETRILESLAIVENQVYTERYAGTDGRSYSTTYFVGYIPKPTTPTFTQLSSPIRSSCVSAEAETYRWIKMGEASQYLHKRRAHFLTHITNYIHAQNPQYYKNGTTIEQIHEEHFDASVYGNDIIALTTPKSYWIVRRNQRRRKKPPKGDQAPMGFICINSL